MITRNRTLFNKILIKAAMIIVLMILKDTIL